MKEARIIMGMPISIEVVDSSCTKEILAKAFDYFTYVDQKFSTYKKESEISKINRREIGRSDYSEDMKTVFELSEKTKAETNGFFDIKKPDNSYDPSGLVKGWAIYNCGKLLESEGLHNFYVEAGGDIQVKGLNKEGKKWQVGIRNPFNLKEIVQVLHLGGNEGVATSGTYERGNHIYNPKDHSKSITDIVSLTVVGPNIYEADRFATAAFAMGKEGIYFIENLKGFEGYAINMDRIGTMTSNFKNYLT